jgi:hypothetical protein
MLSEAHSNGCAGDGATGERVLQDMKIHTLVARLAAQLVQVFHGEATVLGQRQRLRTRDLRGHIGHHGCFLVAIETQGLLLTSRAVWLAEPPGTP